LDTVADAVDTIMAAPELALVPASAPQPAAGTLRPSDTIQSFRLSLSWTPQEKALGVPLGPDACRLPPGTALHIDAQALDISRILDLALGTHVRAILNAFGAQLVRQPAFGRPGAVVLEEEPTGTPDVTAPVLRVRLCGNEEAVLVTLDARTGRLSLRDTGDLAAAARGSRLGSLGDRLNESPVMLLDALARLRLHTIVDLAEQKARYLGLKTYRVRNFAGEELVKLGGGPAAAVGGGVGGMGASGTGGGGTVNVGSTAMRSSLYVQLERRPEHYLVLVITDERFRFALISVQPVKDAPVEKLKIVDVGWLDVGKVCGEMGEADVGTAAGLEAPGLEEAFTLKVSVLRALYAYCW
jgi:mediator of RNA polymerase II transcription subunit 14